MDSTARPARSLSRPAAVVAGLCLVVPAALDATAHLIDPVTATTLRAALQQIQAQPALAMAAACLPLALPVLAVGVLALACRASARSPRLAAIGGALLAVAYLLSGTGTAQDVAEAALPGDVPAGTAIAVARSLDGLPGHLEQALVPVQAAGLLVLGIALWRSRTVPRPLAAAFLVTLPLQILTHGAGSAALPALSWGWFTLVLLACAAVLVRGAEPGGARDPEGSTAAAPTSTMSA